MLLAAEATASGFRFLMGDDLPHILSCQSSHAVGSGEAKQMGAVKSLPQTSAGLAKLGIDFT